MITIFCIALFLLYACHLHFYLHKKYVKNRKEEELKFINYMKTLGEEQNSYELLHKMSLKELSKANNRLDKSFKKHKKLYQECENYLK